MNKYGQALYIMGWVVIIFGFIGSCILGGTFTDRYSDFNWSIFLGGMLSSTFMALLVFGLGEIINILDDNRKYLKTLTEKSSTQEEEIRDELPEI